MAVTLSTRIIPGKTTIEKLYNSVKGPSYVRVGLPDTPHWNADLTIAQIGMIHEYGAPRANIDERPFLHTGIAEGASQINTLSKSVLTAVINAEMTKEQALEKLGLLGVRLVQEKIREGPFKALKAATIRRKGSSAPLIDTGQMRQSVTYALEW